MRPPIDKYRTLQFGQFTEIKVNFTLLPIFKFHFFLFQFELFIKKECGYNYGKILFDTWIKHAGSIERFLYKRNNKAINNSFTKKSKINSPEKSKIDSAILKRHLSTNNNYQFEDLSQFVCQEQDQYNYNQTKSILKARASSDTEKLKTGSDKDDEEYVKQRRRLRQSKSVQINNEDCIYSKLSLYKSSPYPMVIYRP